MRRVVGSMLLAAILSTLPACGPTPTGTGGRKGATLKVGDPAPPLAVETWLNGDPVPALEPGKVYVLEFWATWCAPCIEAMPHLAELQRKYADQGLVVIPVTTADGNNTQENVGAYLYKHRGQFPMPFAFCSTKDTERAYMRAAKQTGIPTSFVVGRDGKIAYIGMPHKLDEVLPAVLAAK